MKNNETRTIGSNLDGKMSVDRIQKLNTANFTAIQK